MSECTFPPPKPFIKRVVALPSSNFSNLSEPARTFHIAFLARTLGIFRVEEVAIFRHEGHPCGKVAEVLKALETPQYLRRRLIPIKKELKYIGLVPPLAIPPHQLRRDDYDLREGVVIARHGKSLLIDAGLEKPLLVEGNAAVGKRVTIRRELNGWSLVQPSDLNIYWNFRISCFKDLLSVVETYRKKDFLIVATSRRGEGLTYEKLNSIKGELIKRGSKGVLFLFGSWRKGLFEIASEHNQSLQELSDYILNTLPCQGTRSVRTEEAVLATLSVFNIFLD
ncbi:putative RNA uridine N3 methyltransferase [Infirmifilum uzonense]|uniref:putative RNA uridine N3 methyltransferase n=1 Tax=Infirmifilum uzonense TaxID=1550241 RepID=UPI00069931B2|nr:RNA methyltransferase [Infirmifilum uzonense]